MATVTNYGKDREKGYCSRCDAFFTYSSSELYAEHNGFFNWGKSYLYCPGCGAKVYNTFNCKENKETGEYHTIFKE